LARAAVVAEGCAWREKRRALRASHSELGAAIDAEKSAVAISLAALSTTHQRKENFYNDFVRTATSTTRWAVPAQEARFMV